MYVSHLQLVRIFSMLRELDVLAPLLVRQNNQGLVCKTSPGVDPFCYESRNNVELRRDMVVRLVFLVLFYY